MQEDQTNAFDYAKLRDARGHGARRSVARQRRRGEERGEGEPEADPACVVELVGAGHHHVEAVGRATDGLETFEDHGQAHDRGEGGAEQRTEDEERVADAQTPPERALSRADTCGDEPGQRERGERQHPPPALVDPTGDVARRGAGVAERVEAAACDCGEREEQPIEARGMDDVWQTILDYREKLGASGELAQRRREQQQAWFWSMLRDGLERHFLGRADVRAQLPELEREVIAGTLTPTAAAARLLALLDGGLARKD